MTSRHLAEIGANVTFVVGNESCDLDSAVSAISLAYYYTNREKDDEESPVDPYVPLLNVHRDDVKLKTELVFLCKKYGLDINMLLCR